MNTPAVVGRMRQPTMQRNICLAVLLLAVVILIIMTVNRKQQKEDFSEVDMQPTMQTRQAGPTLAATQAIQDYPSSISMDVGSTVQDVAQKGAEYSDAVLAYTNPSGQNLELASNQPMSGLNAPGKCNYYSDPVTGNGFVDYCGELGGQTYPAVDFPGRDQKLSQCAKDLPMFAASSLLPKASPNADTQELTQEAAQALAALTNLSPIEQFGAPTNFGLPQEVVSSERPAPPVANYLDRPLVAFQQSSYANQRVDGGLNAGDRGGNGLN